MVVWKPLSIKDAFKRGHAMNAVSQAEREDRRVALYYTPERGWYGWQSCGEVDCSPMLQIVHVPTFDGGVARVFDSQILKIADSIRTGGPDECHATDSSTDQ